VGSGAAGYWDNLRRGNHHLLLGQKETRVDGVNVIMRNANVGGGVFASQGNPIGPGAGARVEGNRWQQKSRLVRRFFVRLMHQGRLKVTE
jgi:hypothetical protein